MSRPRSPARSPERADSRRREPERDPAAARQAEELVAAKRERVRELRLVPHVRRRSTSPITSNGLNEVRTSSVPDRSGGGRRDVRRASSVSPKSSDAVASRGRRVDRDPAGARRSGSPSSRRRTPRAASSGTTADARRLGHATLPRTWKRRSAQRRSVHPCATSGDDGTTGSRSSERNADTVARSGSRSRRAARRPLARSARVARDAPRRVDERHDDAADVREALLPGGSWIRTGTRSQRPRAPPHLAIDAVEEVGRRRRTCRAAGRADGRRVRIGRSSESPGARVRASLMLVQFLLASRGTPECAHVAEVEGIRCTRARRSRCRRSTSRRVDTSGLESHGTAVGTATSSAAGRATTPASLFPRLSRTMISCAEGEAESSPARPESESMASTLSPRPVRPILRRQSPPRRHAVQRPPRCTDRPTTRLARERDYARREEGHSRAVALALRRGAPPGADRRRAGRELEALPPELLDGPAPTADSPLGHEARREDDAVHEHRTEQVVDVLRRHVRARLSSAQAAAALSSEAPAHRRADRDRLDAARRAHEPDDPPPDHGVDVHPLHGRAELVDLGEAHDRLQQRQRVAADLLVEDPSSSSSPG